jgi:hypothetical protein
MRRERGDLAVGWQSLGMAYQSVVRVHAGGDAEDDGDGDGDTSDSEVRGMDSTH